MLAWLWRNDAAQNFGLDAQLVARNFGRSPRQAEPFLSEAASVIDRGVVRAHAEPMGAVEHGLLIRMGRRCCAGVAAQIGPTESSAFNVVVHLPREKSALLDGLNLD